MANLHSSDPHTHQGTPRTPGFPQSGAGDSPGAWFLPRHPSLSLCVCVCVSQAPLYYYYNYYNIIVLLYWMRKGASVFMEVLGMPQHVLET